MLQVWRFFLVLCLCLQVLLIPLPVSAYSQGHLDGHAIMLKQAIQILRNDNYTIIANLAAQNLEALLDGIQEADDQYGRIFLDIDLIPAAEWNNAGNTHYYNPGAHHEQAGLKIGLLHGTDTSIYFGYGWFINVRLEEDPFGLPGGDSNRVFALRGPQPSADRLADWYYAQAVSAMRLHNTRDAYLNLGKAIHMVQDLTIPHHAADSFGVCDLHQEYEDNAELTLESGYCLERSGYDLYTLADWPVSEYAKEMAILSRDYLGDVTEWWGLAHTIDAYGDVFPKLLPLAQQLAALILYKFHKNWQTEPYSAMQLTVHRAKALDGPDGWAADLFVSLNVLEPGEEASSHSDNFDTYDFVTGYFGDEDEVWPASYLGYNVWTFPYTSDTVRTAEEVQMVLALWDDDDIDAWTNGVAGWPEGWYVPEWIDINPLDGYRLWLKANFRTGEVSRWTGSEWFVIGRLGEKITSIGNQSGTPDGTSQGGRGEIVFSINGTYVPAEEPVPIPPQAPINIFPGANSTGEEIASGVSLTPVLCASSYADPDMSPQMDSEWLIYDFVTGYYGKDEPVPVTVKRVVFNSSNGARTFQEVISPLEPGTLYKWQVRYQDSTGLWSAWSQETSFITDRPPQTPVNESPAAGATGVSYELVLNASAYFDPEGQTHIASQWNIGLPVIGGEYGWMGPIGLPVYDYVSEGTTSHRVTMTLNANTTYRWQVRYQDALGVWSEWSEPTLFTTTNILIPPIGM